jgi:hypothetical protein
LVLTGDPLIAAVLNQDGARRVVVFADVVIGGEWCLDLDVREKPWLAVLLQRCSATLPGAAPEVEKKFRAVLAVPAEVAVFAQIDRRVEDSGQDPAVLEKVVSRRWLVGL